MSKQPWPASRLRKQRPVLPRWPLPPLLQHQRRRLQGQAPRSWDLLGLKYRQEPLTNMRRTIARRLSEAKQQVPHFYLTVDCEIDALLELRKQLNERTGGEVKISVNDFVI